MPSTPCTELASFLYCSGLLLSTTSSSVLQDLVVPNIVHRRLPAWSGLLLSPTCSFGWLHAQQASQILLRDNNYCNASPFLSQVANTRIERPMAAPHHVQQTMCYPRASLGSDDRTAHGIGGGGSQRRRVMALSDTKESAYNIMPMSQPQPPMSQPPLPTSHCQGIEDVTITVKLLRGAAADIVVQSTASPPPSFVLARVKPRDVPQNDP